MRLPSEKAMLGLATTLLNQPEEIPHPGPGWFTIRELGQAMKLSRRAIEERMKRAVAKGQAESCQGWVPDRQGRKQAATFYRQIK